MNINTKIRNILADLNPKVLTRMGTRSDACAREWGELLAPKVGSRDVRRFVLDERPRVAVAPGRLNRPHQQTPTHILCHAPLIGHRRFSPERCWRRGAESCRKFGISASSYHRWKSRYGGMEISELRRMKSLELENEQLKRLVADLSLDAVYLKAALAKTY